MANFFQLKNNEMAQFRSFLPRICYSWSANELLEPLLNPGGTGWSLASYIFLLTQRKWFKLNAVFTIKYTNNKTSSVFRFFELEMSHLIVLKRDEYFEPKLKFEIQSRYSSNFQPSQSYTHVITPPSMTF